MAQPNLTHVDPSIRNCAVALISEAIDTINGTLQADPDESYWVARDKALSAAANRWVSAYGKECADAAVRGLHCLAPSEVIERDTKAIQRDNRVAYCRRTLTELDPTRDTWLNRFWISMTGYRLYGLVLAFLAASLALQPASPALAGGVSTWRALALCGVSKPGAARHRACRQFNSAERSSFRGYDAQGGAPRSWELPRAWEIQP